MSNPLSITRERSMLSNQTPENARARDVSPSQDSNLCSLSRVRESVPLQTLDRRYRLHITHKILFLTSPISQHTHKQQF